MLADTTAPFDGRYELDGVLGSGGSGTVHRAWDRVLDRPVALKLLRPGSDDDGTHQARLRAEARLAGSVHHPGIAQIYDFGEAPPVGAADLATPYIVMQLVDGTPLDAVLRERRRLGAAEVMGILHRVAEALTAAHDQGIVHRDLKPANILLMPNGTPVLVDFGIARSADLEPFTRTGTIVGSVDYISPEQAAGQAATPLSDVYSLGIVAYEALTGRRPFHRESQVATAVAHLHDDAPPLPADVPAPVAELVEAMVQREPARRPASAAEVAERACHLAAELAGTDAPLLPPPPEPPAWAAPEDHGTVTTELALPPRRRLGRVYLGAVLLAAAIVASYLVAAGNADARVPDVHGLRYAEAVQLLQRHGIDHVERRYVDDPGEERGTVLRQVPAAGSHVGQDDVVTLRVASGQERVLARDLLGSTYAAAARRVVALGMAPRRVEVVQSEGVGTVVAVAPTGRLRLGATVTLTVAVAPAPPPTTSQPGDGGGGKGGGGSGTSGKGKGPKDPPGHARRRAARH